MTFSTAHVGITALLVALVSVPIALVWLRPARAVEVAVVAGLTTFG